MRQWVRQWSITIEWDQVKFSPGSTTRYQTHVGTVRELRRLVEAARADPHVWRYRYESIRVLAGDEPRHCPAGHVYTHARRNGCPVDEWLPCTCGGHHVLVCLEPDCPHPRLPDPPIDDGCDASPPSSTA